jgi:hypothetical protein
LPLMSKTVDVIVELPPLADTVPGFASIVMRPTAAAPIATLTGLLLLLAPPDKAVIVAMPF